MVAVVIIMAVVTTVATIMADTVEVAIITATVEVATITAAMVAATDGGYGGGGNNYGGYGGGGNSESNNSFANKSSEHKVGKIEVMVAPLKTMNMKVVEVGEKRSFQ